MRSPVLAFAAAATLLASLSARADEDEPFPTPADDGLPSLTTLPDLPPLPALPPLDGVEEAPTPAPAPAPEARIMPRPVPPPPPPATSAAPPTYEGVSVPAAQAAVLGQYDEYRRAIAAYSMDQSPVSSAEYARCVAAGKCTRPSCSVRSGQAPVACVDLAQAKAYCDAQGRRLPTEDEWEHAARDARTLGLRGMTDGRLEWTSSPYCFFCGKDDEVARGGPTRNPALRSWRPPTTRDAALGFRCAE
jgi:hypothetical protein